ncbi:MAG: hypothetical protein AAGH38_10585 [Pseudomonadota bacterium]
MFIFDAIGIFGVILVLMSYFLLQAERLRSDGVRYLLMNAIGAVLILVSLLKTFNLASFVIEICWLAISIYGLVRVAMRSSKGRP